MRLILIHVLSFSVGAFSIPARYLSAQNQTADGAGAKEKPVIQTVDIALNLSAENRSPLQLEATLALSDFALKDEAARSKVIQLLLQHLKPGGDQLVQSTAEVAVRKLGTLILPQVERALSSQELAEQAAACNAIRVIGLPAIELLPQLTEMLETGDPLLQRAALYAMQGFGDQAFEALDAVAACLESHDFNVQCMACRVLENYGADALVAENSLVEILNTGNPSSRGWAAIVLGAIGPTDQNDVVPMLIARLREARAHVEKQRILLGLAHLGREAKRAIPVVTEFMNDRRHRVKPHSAFALFKIADERELLQKVLGEALDDINQRQDAFDLINRLGEDAVVLKASLIAQLASPDEDVREQAALAIGRLGPEASDALPVVKKLLSDPDPLVREAAKATMAAITFNAEDDDS
jgi:HEAT repeat protein